MTGRCKVDVKGATTLLGRSFLLYPVLPWPGAGPAADFGRIHLGRDNDESKAASGGRRRNGKDEVGMVWVCGGVPADVVVNA